MITASAPVRVCDNGGWTDTWFGGPGRVLNIAVSPEDMNLPGLELHELRGARKGTWAVQVSGNWRVTFAWIGKDVDRVDYEDYH